MYGRIMALDEMDLDLGGSMCLLIGGAFDGMKLFILDDKPTVACKLENCYYIYKRDRNNSFTYEGVTDERVSATGSHIQTEET